MTFSVKEDRLLLSRCFSGNRKAAETLVRRFSDLVYGAVQYTLMSKQVSFNTYDLEDLHNTIFLRLFENDYKRLRQYQGKNGCSLGSWIRMVAVRTVLDHLRKNDLDSMVWQKKLVPIEQAFGIKQDEIEPWAAMNKEKQGHLLQDGIQSLSSRYKLFMKLYFEHGLSIAQVAELMQISIENAYTVKHRAIQKLKLYVDEVANSRM
ncbi:MAG: sigma-70 family RNA polymerase sigma factor [Desulfotignum sp.]|nr:sigma-70 family RNA polymerase sigma factor [Desulfotignum sp.]MCF8136222.1 sigma-70 family RNA polymerase sigma factor [Desulfotignum sp.]